jgi:hypothetical protein
VAGTPGHTHPWRPHLVRGPHGLQLELAAGHGEGRALEEEAPEVLDALAKRVARAPDAHGLRLLQRCELLAPVERLLL